VDLHLVARVAVRSYPIDRLLHPVPALHEKRLGQKQTRGRRRQSYGRAAVSTGAKAPFKRGSDVSQIVLYRAPRRPSGLQVEKIVPAVLQ
jgi:hypothetical protein